MGARRTRKYGIELVERFNLNQYSLIALNKTPIDIASKQDVANNNTTIKNNKITITSTVVADETDDAETVVKTSKAFETEKVDYPNTIFTINNAKVIYATAGTSILALAEQYNISLSKLFEINDMDEVEILEKPRLIFLEKKQKKGTADFHIVLPNETLQDIAQKEGVRLDMIVEYNGVSKKLHPVLGEKIYLRSKAPASPKMSTAIAANPTKTSPSTN